MKLRLLILSCILSLGTFSQNDFPYGKIKVRNFTSKEYAATAQNWDMIQDNNYFFYIANNGGILEYNGEDWNKLEMNNGEHPRSFDKNDSGRVYVGGRGEFGFIDHDANGKTIYSKLSGPVDSLTFSDVWSVYCLGEHTYFISEDYVFIYYNNELEVIDVPEGEYIEMSTRLEELIICSFEGDLGDRSFVLRGNKFFEVQNSLGTNPAILYNYGSKKIMIDKTGAMYEFQQNGNAYQYILIPEKRLEIAAGSKINDIKIQNNLLVACTAGSGVRIYDMEGQLVRTFIERDGLENMEIRAVYFDQYHNIWLCNDNGLSFIETSDAMTSFDKDFGITGTTEDIYLRNDKIYLATHTDIYANAYKPGELLFENQGIFGMEVYQIKDFTFPDNSTYTLVIANDGVYYLDDRMQRKLITTIYAWDMCQSKVDKNRILFGLDGDGVTSIYYSNGKFTFEGNYPNTSGEVRSILEVDGKVYYAVKKDGIHILDTTRLQEKNQLQGLKQYKDSTMAYSQFTLCEFNNQIYVGTSNGLYTIVNDKLVPSDLEQGSFYHEKLLVHRIINDNDERLWMVTFHNADSKDEYSEIGYFENTNGVFEWNSGPFKQITDDVVHTIKRGNDGLYWFGGNRKVYVYNSNYQSNFDLPFHSFIYQVSLGEDSVLVYNTHHAKQTETFINYKYNSIRFNFTTNAYLGGIENQYSYYLEGFDSTWGKWKTANSAEYQRLGEGEYTFHVKAMNYYGYESEPVSFSFTILPPWYRTIWAYIIYFLLFVLLIYVIIRLSIRRVKQQKEELEKIVQERTHEIAKQNHLLEHQKAEIEEKTNDILDSIKYAKRIQNTILPGEDKLKTIFDHDHFVLYKPKDIVSGDFYWAGRFENKTIFSAIDCTGHGVPGAFVSIVGFNALNRTVNEFKLRQPAAILDKLTELVVDTFSQSESNIKDGMDIGLCAIDNKTLKLEFSGANNPCIVVRRGEAIELKADKQPIGEFEGRKPFTNHEFQLEKGDCVYVLSDGYADQFGGPKGKKLKFKALRDQLIEISSLDVKTQLKKLDDSFNEWKGDYEQLDDVCLFGVRIK
ncbi:MAG: SpoIIE family protein phosphatase [Bacteroidetes bacterium]|nr:SpoIIE family protein phosphatase [Bacteroidota bacterium]